MPKTILLIDNDSDLVGTLAGVLEERGFSVLKTADGKEGIDLARSRLPDLVVVSVELPKTSGYTICSKLKKDDASRVRAIPVVLTSSEAKPKTFEDHRKLKVGRADEYLLKPYSPGALIEKIETLIGLPEDHPSTDPDGVPFDASGLAEEISMGDEPIVIDEADEVLPTDESPTPATLPGDEDLAVLDAAFDGLEEKDDAGLGRHGAPPPPPPAALLPSEEAAAPAPPTSRPASGRDKDYFALKERLAQRDRELLKVREELNEKDRELVEEREKQTSLEQELARVEAELEQRDGQLRTLQQRLDALSAAQKRAERDLAAARDETRALPAKVQGLEQDLAQARAAVGAREAEAGRREGELRSRIEDANRRAAAMEENAARSEERAATALEQVKADQKVKERVAKALKIALQLIEEPPAQKTDEPRA